MSLISCSFFGLLIRKYELWDIYEKGKINPALTVLERISDEFDVNFIRKSNKELERKIEELHKNLLDIQRLFKESLSI